MIPPAQHLYLRERRELAVRTAISRCLDRAVFTLDKDVQADLDHLQAILLADATRSGAKDADTRTVGDYVSSLVAAHLSDIPESEDAQSPIKQAFYGQKRALADAFKRIDCTSCAGKLKKPCNGSEDDDALVAAAGLCLTELNGLSRAIALHVEAFYRQRLDASRLWSVHNVFSTRATDKPDVFQARTKHEDGGVGGGHALVSSIEIVFNVAEFGLRTLSRVCYALFHEYFCHAFQGCLATSKRAQCDHVCAWTEGWMDTLAYSAAVDWINDSTHSDAPWPSQYSATAAADIQPLHDLRYKNTGPFEARAMGRTSFRLLSLRLKEERSADVGSTKSELEDFSVRLNALPVENRMRRHISDHLFILLQEHVSATRRSRAVSACRNFLGTNDVDALLADLRSATTA